MARIARSEHAKIQQMVQAEGRKVPEIAAMYGCSPANIYAILSKLRRQDGPAAHAPAEPMPPDERPIEASCPAAPRPAAVAHGGMAGDLLAAIEGETAAAASTVAGSGPSEGPYAAAPPSEPEQAPPLVVEPVPPPAAERSQAAPPEPRPAAGPRPVPAGAGRRPAASLSLVESKPAKAARPGYALCMRSAEGDESSTPFRSLDDLLSAVKPILRNVARSPDPVWFSITQVNLADIETEAA